MKALRDPQSNLEEDPAVGNKFMFRKAPQLALLMSALSTHLIITARRGLRRWIRLRFGRGESTHWKNPNFK
jgi:hypothetical protein